MTDSTYKKYFDLDVIMTDIESYLPKFNKELFLKAFDFAEKAHHGQFRKDGVTPYFVHPVSAMMILVSMHADQDVLISALLHDVPEDTKFDIHEVKHMFGEEVSFLVDGITKLSKVHYQHNMPEREIESLKKLFLHTAKDPRVILIKLADRLHNMRTLQFIDKPEKRLRIATETLEIFVPIANLLGMNLIKTELEDLCFKFLFPTEYDKLKFKIKDGNDRNKQGVKKIIETVEKELVKQKITAEISPREKGLYRAYKRICSIGRTIDTIRDRISLKILVKNETECYQVLGIIHKIFTPKTHSFEDYIANPKINGYQSLHTIIFGMNGIETEIQIQTKQMNLESEYGIAAAYFQNKPLVIDREKYSWLDNIMAIEKGQNVSSDFLSDLKVDIFQERILVFTPKGRSVDLPKGASVIDFAYAIHSDIGNHAVKAEINGETGPITTILKTGDIVNVMTEQEAYPELYWLSFTKTNVAKNKILAHLRKTSRQKKMEEGRKLLQKEFDIAGLGLCHDISFRKTRDFLNKAFNQTFTNIKDLYVAIGGGEIKAINVLKALKDIDKKFHGVLENKKESGIKVEIKITAKNRFGLLRDVSSIFYRHVNDLLYFNAWTSRNFEYAHFKVQAIVSDIEDVSHIFEELEQFDDVYSVYRVSPKGTSMVYLTSILAVIIWIIHPVLLQSFLQYEERPDADLFLADGLILFGLSSLVLIILYLTSLIKRYFPLARDRMLIWITSFVAPLIAIAVLFAELSSWNNHLRTTFTIIALVLVSIFLGINYLSYKKMN